MLGHERKLTIDDWIAPDLKRYELKRDVVWDAADRSAKEAPKRIAGTPGKSSEEPEFETPTRHSHLQTISLIRERLWNDAKWGGTGFISWKDDSQPPLMALLFRYRQPAIEIFEGWREELGDDDRDDLLRVAIVRGISAKHPAHYRVVIGTALETVEEKPEPLKGRMLMMSRIHTMTPATTENLDRFLASVAATGAYALAPGGMDGDGDMVTGEPTLLKRKLVIREAWEIGRHDPDSAAIDVDDDVYIPATKTKAPVKEVLRWLRKKRRH